MLRIVVLLSVVMVSVTYACIGDWQQCQPDGSMGNCCSGFCSKQGGWAVGNCKPGGFKLFKRDAYEPMEPQDEGEGGEGGEGGDCKPMWDNQCTSNDQCCSKNCWKGGNWKFGVCKP